MVVTSNRHCLYILNCKRYIFLRIGTCVVYTGLVILMRVQSGMVINTCSSWARLSVLSDSLSVRLANLTFPFPSKSETQPKSQILFSLETLEGAGLLPKNSRVHWCREQKSLQWPNSLLLWTPMLNGSEVCLENGADKWSPGSSAKK